jgi:hypothetical protein
MDILSIFGIRGRAKEVYRLDGAMRVVGLCQRCLMSESGQTQK